MGFGPQINAGQASKIFMGGYGSQGNPVAPTAVDSEGVVLGRMQDKQAQRALDFQVNNATAGRLSDNANRAADRDTQLQLGMAPINLKRDIFNQVSPLLTGLVGNAGNGDRVGGTNSPPPDITRGGIWSPQQVDEQVNAAKSANAANADRTTRGNATSLAAQGFGSRSPLLAALNASTQMQRAGADATADRETRWNAAEGNAQQTTRTDQLAVDRWDRTEKNDIARRQAANNYTSSLASILASLG